MDKKAPTHIVQQELALDSYLQTLLAEIPTDLPDEMPVVVAPVVTKPAPKTVPVVVKLEPVPPKPVPTEPVRQLPAAPLQVEQVKPLMVIPPPSPVATEQVTAVSAPETKKLHALSLMPDWSRGEFQALFFRIEHLILAVPLTELSRTLLFTRKPTKIPNQPTWFLGLLQDQDKKIGILDTGQLIFGKLRGSQRDLTAQPFSCLLVSGDGNWGLACDEILSVGKLSPDKVRWRTYRQKRPWLIGTVTEELTAVIDIVQLLPRRKSG